MERRLYEAALSGDVPTLNALIQEDELILDRLSLTSLSENPLHIAALRGHLEFTRALLRRKPSLATKPDSLGHYPLHLASAEGHSQIVSELLKVNSDVCNLRDQFGRIPLHLAAMRGCVEVIQELIQARPESVREKLDPRGDSVLHLCVMYAHLDALKFLLINNFKDDEDFIKSTNNDGNTILHLAVALKQMETLKYIMSSDVVNNEELASKKNVNGFTALDVLEQCPHRDMKGMEIQEYFLVRLAAAAGVLQRAKAKPHTTNNSSSSSSSINPHQKNRRANKAREILSNVWNDYIKTDTKWIEEARGNLMTTAALTATVAFQVGTNPPGGVWQDDKQPNSTTTDHDKHVDVGHIAGTAIWSTNFPADYHDILIYNTVALYASMSIIILIISGVPIQNRVPLGFLTFALITAITCMVITYLNSLPRIAPNLGFSYVWDSAYAISYYPWIGVCAVVLLLKITRLYMWYKDQNSSPTKKESILQTVTPSVGVGVGPQDSQITISSLES